MAGHLFFGVILLISVGAWAGDQPPDASGREEGERAHPITSSAISRRRMLYHLAEGSEIFPLDWLMALRSVKTGKPFLDDPERFGLIQDPETLEIPGYGDVKLPIGLDNRNTQGCGRCRRCHQTALGPPDLLGIRMVGVNCAACHVGRLRYNNKDLPIIEGAPNTFNIDSFYQDLSESAAKTILNQDKFETFLSDLGKLGAKSEISNVLVANSDRIKKNPSHVRSIVDSAIIHRVRELLERADLNSLQQEGDVITKIVELLKKSKSKNEGDPINRFLYAYGLFFNRLDFLRTLASLHTGGEQVTRPGPGRIDAFGNVRRLVFTNAPKVPLNAPVSFPHLWGVRQLEWFHWDGNTNSSMERNIGQAMGLGAIADLATGASTILPLNIHALESLFSQLSPPDWPEDQFGAVDTGSDRYRRGATLYVQQCAKCHDRQEGGQKSPDGSITYGLQEIGTDPLRAQNFAKTLEGEKPFTRELQAVAEKVKNHATAGANPGEYRGQLDLPEKADPMAHESWLRGTVAPEGIWATAPYLHNGSVPTLDDLLKPENERPVSFPLGHREYDPVKLGYVSDRSKVPAVDQSRIFMYDTEIAGNSNKGHLYGTRLSSSDRKALLEYLKVMDPPDMFPPVSRQEPNGVGIEDVPASEKDDIEQLTSLQLEQMRMEAQAKDLNPTERGQHPKHHGFLVAKFTVADNVPAELKVGLFREPKTYTAVLRFSSTGEQDDRVIDNHGMAIKLLGVKPTLPSENQHDPATHTQDFVLLDHPLFFTPNVATLVAFSQKKKSVILDRRLKGKELHDALKEAFPNEMRLLDGRKKHIKSPLEEAYFSTTPYKLGKTAVKVQRAQARTVQRLPPRRLGRTIEGARATGECTNNAATGGKIWILRPASDRSRVDADRKGPDCRMEIRLERKWRRLKSTRRSLISRNDGNGGPGSRSLPGTPSLSIVRWGASTGHARPFIPPVPGCAMATHPLRKSRSRLRFP